MQKSDIDIPLQAINDPVLDRYGVSLYIKREDLIDAEISGNKWRKLKYNLELAVREKHSTLLTFGGAFSNHIAAVAAAGRRHGLQTIGVIRGEETLPLNDTLRRAVENGMRLTYLNREAYKLKEAAGTLEQLRREFGRFYLLPEGGSNAAAVKGCAEILDERTREFELICCPVGSGGTLAGLAASKEDGQRLLGFSALKGGGFLHQQVAQLLNEYAAWSGTVFSTRPVFEINTAYHFGGYAKITPELIEFIRAFYERTAIPLDLIYSGKTLYGIYDLICKGNLQSKKILMVHTGGLQGNAGLLERYKIHNLF